jgi:hypothetical protein
MINCGYVRTRSKASCPTDHGRNRLNDSEYKADAEGIAQTRAIENCTFAQRCGEGIGRHAQCQDDGGERVHNSETTGRKQYAP